MILERSWEDRHRAHVERVDALVGEHESRKARGIAHPVEDFLFTYYVYRPNQLRRWHPGVGTVIADPSAPHKEWPFYAVQGASIVVDSSELARQRRPLIELVRRLMRSTLDRPARHGCFGMHEWAMVYRLDPGQVRHSSWPLRLSPDAVQSTVDERGLHCTHFDAFRFFTAPAAPLNEQQLSRDSQVAQEQPGCLHAGMDLYKWAYKLSPATSSELVADAFELARDIRHIDMQASPYDLSDLGIEPIRVETPAGRAQYVTQQREFTERARPIRKQLLAVCESLRAAA